MSATLIDASGQMSSTRLVLLDSLWSPIEEEREQPECLVRPGLGPPERVNRKPTVADHQWADGAHAHASWSWRGGEMVLDRNDGRLVGADLGGIHVYLTG